jgi:hypothetical protein
MARSDHPIPPVHERSYSEVMLLMEAAAWGLAGGSAAGLLSVSTEIQKRGLPPKDELLARGIVFGIGLVLGVLVAAANFAQLAGAFPALLLGASAPSVMRGALGRLEVAERKPGGG